MNASARKLFRPHPVYGYQFIPHLKARVPHESGGYLLATNGSGFRCRHEFTPSKGDARRVLLFGDSYTAGDGVRNEERYGDLVESLLPGVEVFNFGLSGSGTDQQYLVWREEAAEIECDAVVIAVLVENVRRIQSRYRPYQNDNGEITIYAKPWFEITERGLELRNVPVPAEPIAPGDLPESERGHVDQGGRLAGVRKVVNWLGAKDMIQQLTGYQPVPEYDHTGNPGWSLMKAILRKWTGEVGVPVIIFPMPLYQHVEESASSEGYQARFLELHEPPRVRVHDPLPYFLRHTRAERRSFRFRQDVHPTPAAHKVLAESLADALRPVIEVRK